LKDNKDNKVDGRFHLSSLDKITDTNKDGVVSYIEKKEEEQRLQRPYKKRDRNHIDKEDLGLSIERTR